MWDDVVRRGFPAKPHERGAKDVVFLGENETVRLPIKFEILDPVTPAPGPLQDPCKSLPEDDL